MVRSAVATSVLSLGAQVISLVAQVVFAALFGSSPATDAYFAAFAVPAFVSAVFVAATSVVFVPVVVERRSRVGPADADAVSNTVVNLAALSLGAVAIAGAAFSGAILHVTAPGLSPSAHALAEVLGVVLWPSTVASSLIALLAALWQIDSKFGWPAAVPVFGTVVNLLLLVLLAPGLGIVGAALAWTTSVLLQMILLVPVIGRHWRPQLWLMHPGVRDLLAAVWPLLLANLFVRASTVWERYLGSLLPAGELTQLTYASRVVLSISAILSAGPAAVIFPRLAVVAASGDNAGLGRVAATALRSMWLVVAPAAALLIALADRGVELVFERGAFSHADSEAVASLLRIYLLSLTGAVLAIVSGRALYALKATRLVATLSSIESLAYLGYTAWAASILGAAGIALGFAIYMTLSLGWQLIYLRHVTRALRVRSVGPFILSGAVAVMAGLIASLIARIATAPLVAVAAGGAAGVVVYVAGLVAARRVLRLLPVRASGRHMLRGL